VPDWIGILGLGGGVVLMLLRRRASPDFFRNERRMVAGDRIEVVTPEVEFAPVESMI
jgi:hypothetical protein